MPKIRTYELQAEVGNAAVAPRIDASRIGFNRELQQLGGAIGNLGDAIQKRQEQKEISDYSAKISENYAKEKERFRKEADAGTLNKESFLAKFDENFDKTVEGVSTSAGKEYVKQQRIKIRSHFDDEGAVTQAKIAGEKTRNNEITTFNNYSNITYKDPNSYQLNRDLYFSYVDKAVSDGSLPFDKGNELKRMRQRELAINAVKGQIDTDKTGAGARQALIDLGSPKWDTELSAEDKSKLMDHSKTVIKALESDKKETEQNIKRAKEARAEVFKKDILVKLSEGKTNNLASLIALNPDMDANEAKTWTNFVEDARTGKLKSDVNVEIDILDRVHLPYGDERKIVSPSQLMPYVKDKKLSIEGYKMLSKEILSPNTPEAKQAISNRKLMIDAAKESIMGPVGTRDPIGKQQFGLFMQALQAKEQEYVEAGKDPAILHNMNPDNKESFVHEIKTYTRSFRDKMKTKMQGFKSNPAPAPEKVRNPNESEDAYLERMSKSKP